MNWVRRIIVTLGAAVSLLLIFSQAVYASIDAGTFGEVAHSWYIDPGTGSIIIQMLIGVVVGGLAVIGVYRVRVKTFLVNLLSKRRQDKTSEESEDTQ